MKNSKIYPEVSRISLIINLHESIQVPILKPLTISKVRISAAVLF